MTSTRSTRAGNYTRILLFLFFLVSTSGLLFSQEDEEIYVPILVEDEYRGEILMRIEETENLFSHEHLMTILDSFLNEETNLILRDLGEGRDWISIFNLQGSGLEAEFREDYLDLQIHIPPLIRREQDIDLTGGSPKFTGVKIAPAVFSGWVNSSLLMKQVYEESQFTIEESLNIGLNYRSWVLDTAVTFSNSEDFFDLDHARIVKDLPGLTSRAEAGDLSFSMDGADNVSFITGLSLVRNFDIKPEISRTPTGREPLFLEEDSTVEIEVNGRLVREMELSAGLYNIENFGLSEGINQVNIYVTDEEGRSELSLLLPMTSNLLKEREFDYGLAVGVPERNLELPVLAAYQRAGITDNLTFTLKEIVPFHTSQMYLEFNGVGATVIGNFLMKAAFSSVPGESADLSLTGKYTYSNIRKPWIGSFGGVLFYDLIIQSLDSDEAGSSDLTASLYYSLPLPRGFAVTPSFLYSDLADTGRKVRFSAFLRKRLEGGSALSFDMNYTWDESVGHTFSGTVSFSAIFPELNQSLRVQQDIDDQLFYFNWNRFPENTKGLDVNASLQVPFDTQERSTYNIGGGYTADIGTLDLTHRLSTIIDDPEQTQNASQLSFSNGIVFAGDAFGFTRTVRDSFVIVKADEFIQDANIRVNPSGNGEKGVAGKLNAVLPGLTAYRPAPIRLEAEILPIGVELNETQFVFTPTIKSGGLVRAAVMQDVYAGGRLVDTDGEPVVFGFGGLSFVPLSVENVPGEDEEIGDDITSEGEAAETTLLEFFTDEDGFFEIYNLYPGEWEMRLLNIKAGVFRFTIPTDAFGYHEIGEVKEIEQ